ncbi:hypothetical protein ACPRNU_24125 [Chromobacterium vaccinii]|uniref:hypothetical protein n=1 Tax=Chromobacterium vaccinii TaxID=1108595 RepID=UPI003C768101
MQQQLFQAVPCAALGIAFSAASIFFIESECAVIGIKAKMQVNAHAFITLLLARTVVDDHRALQISVANRRPVSHFEGSRSYISIRAGAWLDLQIRHIKHPAPEEGARDKSPFIGQYPKRIRPGYMAANVAACELAFDFLFSERHVPKLCRLRVLQTAADTLLGRRNCLVLGTLHCHGYKDEHRNHG